MKHPTRLSLRAIIVFSYFVFGGAQNPILTTFTPATSSTFLTSITKIPSASTDGCSLINSLISSCESVVPGFTTLNSAQQTICLCYSGSVYQPDFLNSAVLTCAEYLSTATPSLYPNWSSLEGFCKPSSTTINPATSTIGVTPSVIQPSSTTITIGPPKTTVTPIPTTSSTSPGSANPIQNFTPPQIAGVSVGCAVAAFLAGFGVYATCCKGPKKLTREPEMIETVD